MRNIRFCPEQAFAHEQGFSSSPEAGSLQIFRRKTPVGGYGAGIAVLLDDSNVLSEKVGKTSDSPARQLAEIVRPKLPEARVLVGHVRFPSSEFLDTVKFKEAAQPYVETFDPEMTIVSAHNGRIENYMELKKKLKGHIFESEKAKLVDSDYSTLLRISAARI